MWQSIESKLKMYLDVFIIVLLGALALRLIQNMMLNGAIISYLRYVLQSCVSR